MFCSSAAMKLVLLTFCSFYVAVKSSENLKLMNFVNCTSFDEKILTFEACEAKDLTLNFSLYVHESVTNIKVRIFETKNFGSSLISKYFRCAVFSSNW